MLVSARIRVTAAFGRNTDQGMSSEADAVSV